MAELVDALDSKSSEPQIRVGSSPTFGTKKGVSKDAFFFTFIQHSNKTYEEFFHLLFSSLSKRIKSPIV
jgi:hypothetical protein